MSSSYSNQSDPDKVTTPRYPLHSLSSPVGPSHANLVHIQHHLPPMDSFGGYGYPGSSLVPLTIPLVPSNPYPMGHLPLPSLIPGNLQSFGPAQMAIHLAPSQPSQQMYFPAPTFPHIPMASARSPSLFQNYSLNTPFFYPSQVVVEPSLLKPTLTPTGPTLSFPKPTSSHVDIEPTRLRRPEPTRMEGLQAIPENSVPLSCEVVQVGELRAEPKSFSKDASNVLVTECDGERYLLLKETQLHQLTKSISAGTLISLPKQTQESLFPKPELKCQYCDIVVHEEEQLALHMRIHSGKKPYACSQCHKRFSRKDRLRAHARIHSGETPFHCDLCAEKFSVSYHLARHKFQVHGVHKGKLFLRAKKNLSSSGSLSDKPSIEGDEPSDEEDGLEHEIPDPTASDIDSETSVMPDPVALDSLSSPLKRKDSSSDINKKKFRLEP